MGSPRLNSFTDFIRHGYWIRLDCSCGRSAKVDPRLLSQQLLERGGNQHVAKALSRLKCRGCGRRNPAFMPCFGPDFQS